MTRSASSPAELPPGGPPPAGPRPAGPPPAQPPADAQDPARLVFRPDRGSGFVVTVFAVGCLPLATARVALLPLLLLPLGCILWQRRARVVADASGLLVCNGWRTERITWVQVAGFDHAAKGRVRLLRTGRPPLALTGLHRGDLPRLLAVGSGPARGA